MKQNPQRHPMIRWISELDSDNECYRIFTELPVMEHDGIKERQWIANVFEYSDAMEIVNAHNGDNKPETPDDPLHREYDACITELRNIMKRESKTSNMKDIDRYEQYYEECTTNEDDFNEYLKCRCSKTNAD